MNKYEQAVLDEKHRILKLIAFNSNGEISVNHYKDFCDGFVIQDYSETWSDDDLLIETVLDNGGEGQGDSYEIVMRIVENPGKDNENESFLSFDGYYSSWDGTDWMSTDLVHPVDVVVTQYHAVEVI